jgi:phospholipid/cholesterol/gamma-HCH transport system substrate-binding protein
MERSNQIGWAQVRAGVFILITLILAAGAVLLMGQKTKLFVPTSTIRITMQNVVGLKEGAPVWLAGVDVGVVQQIRFDNPRDTNQVLIVAEVDSKAHKKIGTDSLITIKTRGLMGEKYVDILPSATYHEKPGSQFSGTNVHTIDDVAQKAGITFEKLNSIVDNVQSGKGTLGMLATDTRLYLNAVQLSDELKILAGTINRGEGTLGKLARSGEPYDKLMQILARADKTLHDIQSADGSLNRLIYDKTLYTKLVSLADKSNQAADDVRALNRKLTSKDSTLGMLISDRELYDKGLSLITRADTSMKDLESLTARIKAGEGTAGKLINEKELYEKLNRAVDNMDALMVDIKKNPGRYVKLSLF